MGTTRLGIVGVGWIAQVVHLPLLQKLPGAEVVALCDRDRGKVRLVGEKFGIARTYADTEAMLAAEELDAVLVCTSTDAHRSVAVAAIQAGKDVLIEKPIARSYSEAVAIAEAARAQKRKVMVGMNHRFRPDAMVMKSFLDGKELGKVLYTRTGWLRRRSSDSSWFVRKEKSGGGVFLDLGIAMLDMALWTHDYPAVRRVTAHMYHQRTKSVEDTAMVTLALVGGALVQIEVSWSMHIEEDIYYCDVFGQEGTASLQPMRIIKELHGNLVNVAPAKIEDPQTLFRRSYENELKHFLGAIRNVHPVISTAEEAVQRMQIVDAVYRSAKQGKEIVLC